MVGAVAGAGGSANAIGAAAIAAVRLKTRAAVAWRRMVRSLPGSGVALRRLVARGPVLPKNDTGYLMRQRSICCGFEATHGKGGRDGSEHLFAAVDGEHAGARDLH